MSKIEDNSNQNKKIEKTVIKENVNDNFGLEKKEPIKESIKEIYNPEKLIEDDDIILENKEVERPKDKKEINVDYIMKKYLNKTDEDLPEKKRNDEFKQKVKSRKRNSVYLPSAPKFK